MFGVITELGIHLADLCENLADWSRETFGSDEERGPIGPVKHLKKECDEVMANPTDREEYADMLILVIDASRRAGIMPMQLLELAEAKVKKNKSRKWPKPTSDEPVEHVRDF